MNRDRTLSACVSQAKSLFSQGQFISQLNSFSSEHKEPSIPQDWLRPWENTQLRLRKLSMPALQIFFWLSTIYNILNFVLARSVLRFLKICAEPWNFKIILETTEVICFVLFQIAVKSFPAHLVPSTTNHVSLSDRIIIACLKKLLFLEMFAQPFLMDPQLHRARLSIFWIFHVTNREDVVVFLSSSPITQTGPFNSISRLWSAAIPLLMWTFQSVHALNLQDVSV